MRPEPPTFWLLDGPTGWRTTRTDGVLEDQASGLRLAVDPRGVRSVGSADGSLGRLVLPHNVAVDGWGRAFLLAGRRPFLRRLNIGTGVFEPFIDAGTPGTGSSELVDPAAIAAEGSQLAVADPGASQVVVLDTHTRVRRAVWRRRDWVPESVYLTPRFVYVLDGADDVIYRYRDPLRPPERVVPSADGPWRRIAVAEGGDIYLLAEGSPRVDVFDQTGRHLASMTDPGEAAGAFATPPIVSDHRGHIRVPSSLLAGCSAPPHSTEAESRWYDPVTGLPARIATDAWLGPHEYETRGTWIGGPLDSEIYRCQWHRIQLEIGHLPPGSKIRLSTYADSERRELDEVLRTSADLWASMPDMIGPADPRQGPPRADAAVTSSEGRYLWLRLELEGDGYATPEVQGMRVHYPRLSHLQLLPAVYSADDTARRFTERFLSVMQTQLEPVEHLIRDLGGLFDPEAAPEVMIDVLSSWLALPVEGAWNIEQRRNLLRAVPGLLRQRGTVPALRRYLRAYLENIVGARLDSNHFPHLVEGYRERTHTWLADDNRIGGRTRLWSPRNVARLQLDRFATEGEVRLVTTGDPDRDVFHRYAHRFKVVIPAPWIRTASQERMIRRAIEAEKPAHASYELALLEPGIRAGRQSTVGLDTVIGAIPRARLACRHPESRAPSSPERGRLGIDTVLCEGPHRPRDMQLTTRIGSNSRLL